MGVQRQIVLLWKSPAGIEYLGRNRCSGLREERRDASAVEGIAVKIYNLSLIPGTHIVNGQPTS